MGVLDEHRPDERVRAGVHHPQRGQGQHPGASGGTPRCRRADRPHPPAGDEQRQQAGPEVGQHVGVDRGVERCRDAVPSGDRTAGVSDRGRHEPDHRDQDAGDVEEAVLRTGTPLHRDQRQPHRQQRGHEDAPQVVGVEGRRDRRWHPSPGPDDVDDQSQREQHADRDEAGAQRPVRVERRLVLQGLPVGCCQGLHGVSLPRPPHCSACSARTVWAFLPRPLRLTREGQSWKTSTFAPRAFSRFGRSS